MHYTNLDNRNDRTKKNGHRKVVKLFQTYRKLGMLAAILLYCTAVQAVPPPLIRAVQNRDIALVTKLVRGSIDLNATDINGHNALHHAIQHNHRQMLELLLTEGADPGFKDMDGNTPFNLAVINEQPTLAAILLKAMVGINGRDDKSWSPLYWAIVSDDWQLVQELLRDGADVAIGRHQNAFDIAKIMGTETKLAAILAKERGINTTYKVLVKAVHKGDTDTIKLLLEHGADIEPRDNNFRTPLMYVAARWGNAEIVALLLGHGANIDTRDSDFFTPLMHAARWGNAGTVKLLFELGANIEAEDNDGKTALIHAARQGSTETAELLIERGARIEAEDNDGKTALMHMIHAARWGNTKIVELLLEHKANINAKDNDGKTTLMYAASEGATKTVMLLLKHGADINAKDNDGKTALIYATTNRGNTEIVELLLAHSANIEEKKTN